MLQGGYSRACRKVLEERPLLVALVGYQVDDGLTLLRDQPLDPAGNRF